MQDLNELDAFTSHAECIHKLQFLKVTGGGAYKFADLFKERLGVTIDKEGEMDCLVAGSNFLLKVRFLIPVAIFSF